MYSNNYNEGEIFEHSLEQEIQKAKQEHTNIALIALRENIIDGISAKDKLLSENIIRKTSVFKDYSFEKDNKRYYYSYAVDMDSFVFDFEVRQIETYIKTIGDEYQACDIVYSSALFPQDGENADILIKKLNSFSKGDRDEKDINS